MRVLLFLALLPSIAWPKFGTEIELVGERHRTEVGCLLSSGAGVVSVLPLAASAYFAESEELGIAAGVAGGAPLLCLALYKARGKANTAYLAKLEAAIRDQRPGAKIEHVPSGTLKQDALEVTYENGAKVIFSQDPHVIEVKTILANAQEAEARATFLQAGIYELAKGVGLQAPKRDGIWNGGHIHIDLEEAFGGDPQKLKRFSLDYWAHPELLDGLLVKDGFNAKPLKLEDPKVRAKVDEFAARMDSLSARGGKLDFIALNDVFRDFVMLFNKDRGLNINARLGTLEMRGLRSQRSAADLVRVLKLLEGQVRFTNAQPDRSLAELLAERATPRGGGDKAAIFRRYVERASLDYAEMKAVVPVRYREGAGTCARLYGALLGR